jgi:TM2 domain-containing membrane protein YozV
MPPIAIMFRVLLFFVIIIIVTLGVISLVTWFVGYLGRIARAKLEADKFVNESYADKMERKLKNEALEKVKKMKV